jgi:hypothetical protein
MKELTIAFAVALLLTTACAAAEKSSLPYVYRQIQFRSRLEFLRFCDHYATITTYELEGEGPCIDDTRASACSLP